MNPTKTTRFFVPILLSLLYKYKMGLYQMRSPIPVKFQIIGSDCRISIVLTIANPMRVRWSKIKCDSFTWNCRLPIFAIVDTVKNTSQHMSENLIWSLCRMFPVGTPCYKVKMFYLDLFGSKKREKRIFLTIFYFSHNLFIVINFYF